MINIIMSKFPEENSLYIYKDIEKKLEENEKSFLIVPEQYTLESDMDFIDNIKYKTVMDAKVLSFSSLISFIYQRLNIRKKESLNAISKTIIITSVLDDLNEDLNLFSNKANDIDFVNDLADFFSNIKEYYFDDDFFSSIFENENIDKMTKIKFKEIKLIYDSYLKKIENSYLDSEDELILIKDSIKDCDFLKNTNFYFDKFDLLSDLRMDFVKELLKIGAKVSVSVPIDSNYFYNPLAGDLTIFDQSMRFIENLRSISKLNIINVEKNQEFSDIKHLYENFEKYNPNIYKKKTDHIRLIESISSTNEVENVALVIEKLIRHGHRYSDIALVMADEGEYENLIKRIFARMDIPIFIDKAKKLTENKLIDSFLIMIILLVYNFKTTDLEAFIRSDIIDFGENALEKILDFQTYINTYKIKGSMIFDDKYFRLDEEFYDGKDDLKDQKQKELKNVNDIRYKLIVLFENLYEIRNKKIGASSLVKEIFNIIDSSMIKSGISHFQENIRESNINIYEENSQIWDKFLTILEQIVAIMKDRKTYLKNIYKLIEKACESSTVSIIPPAIDQVLIGDFNRDRVNDRPIKIFIGMTDIYFPKSNNEDPLISENEKHTLNKEGFDLKIYSTNKADKILLNLLRMFTTSRFIYFSYSLINKSNEPMNKSSVLDDIGNIFENLSYKKIAQRDFSYLKYSLDFLDERAYEILWDEKKLKDLKNAKFLSSYLKYKKDSSTSLNYSKKSPYDLFLKGFNYSSDKENLDGEISKRLFSKNKYSISEVEQYARCPYKHFISYGIRARENDQLDVDSMEIGNIVHYNMEYLSKGLIGKDLSKLTEKDLENIINENFKKAIKDFLEKDRANNSKNKFILKNIYESNKRTNKRVIEQILLGDFKLDAVEERYGKGEKYPPVYVDDENYIEGRIDRIDKLNKYVRIIDYKTGNKEFSIINLFNGIELQLFVYLIAVKENKLEKLEPIASFYLPLKDQVVSLDKTYSEKSIEKSLNNTTKMNGFVVDISGDKEILKTMDKKQNGVSSSVFVKSNNRILSKDDRDNLEKYVRKLISSYIAKIKMGNIKLNPFKDGDYKECTNCPYKSICKLDYSIDQDKFREKIKDISLDDLKKESLDD